MEIDYFEIWTYFKDIVNTNQINKWMNEKQKNEIMN